MQRGLQVIRREGIAEAERIDYHVLQHCLRLRLVEEYQHQARW